MTDGVTCPCCGYRTRDPGLAACRRSFGLTADDVGLSGVDPGPDFSPGPPSDRFAG